MQRNAEFWERFFRHPLVGFLEEDGHSIERLTLYCLIHHDHHFLVLAFEEDSTVSDFDTIRRIVEPDFDDLLIWLDEKLPKFCRPMVITMARFLDPAHEWSKQLGRKRK